MKINFDELIENYLKRDSYPKTIGRYYPSEAGYCIRKNWYSYKYPKETDKDVMKIFKVGNMIHSFLVDVLSSQKNPNIELLESEAPFKLNIDDFVISGRIDDVILLKANKKIIIVEVKSTKNINFIKEAIKTHVDQLMIYMYAKKIYDGAIVYIEKNTLKSKMFEIKYDKNSVDKLIERFKILHKHLKEDTLPEPEAKQNDEMKWMCRYCPYKEECDNNLTKI